MPGFFWGLRRTSRGKKFGNEIADSIGMRRRHFHTALEESGMPMHLVILAELHDEGTSVAESRDMLLPKILEGLRVIEARFGPQSSLAESIRIAKDWLSRESIETSVGARESAAKLGTTSEQISTVTPGTGTDLVQLALNAFRKHWKSRSIKAAIISNFIQSLDSHPSYRDFLLDAKNLKARGSESRESLSHLLTILNYLFMVSDEFPLETDYDRLATMKRRCEDAGLITLENLAFSMQKGGASVEPSPTRESGIFDPMQSAEGFVKPFFDDVYAELGVPQEIVEIVRKHGMVTKEQFEQLLALVELRRLGEISESDFSAKVEKALPKERAPISKQEIQSIKQSLKKHRIYASKTKNGTWKIYHPDGSVLSLDSDNAFVDFVHSLSQKNTNGISDT